ncbi:hypothetical protein Taro_031465 [Colocasia esculenta]|uniref:Enhancer of polycomb-like protein n=1 Tax=Colocasia esculenta TaxID=4460 RepID=A0A843W102_COLES|nr:hypothetical protein [Colocasia esculenta]
MKRHARSNNRGIARKVGDPPEPEKIGSGVSPLRGPPAPMPTVGTRRSTRVFVCKSASKTAQDGDLTAARVLRSGKRLTLSKPGGDKPGGGGDGDAYEWMAFFEGAGDVEDTSWWKGKKGGHKPGKGGKEGQIGEWRRRGTEGIKLGIELPKNVLDEHSAAASPRGRAFGLVYSRKRRRSSSEASDSLHSLTGSKDSRGGSDSLSDGLSPLCSFLGDRGVDDRRYGIAFFRKPRSKKPKLSFLVTGRPRSLEFPEEGFVITETARLFAQKVGISGGSLCSRSMGKIVLVAAIHSTCGASSKKFICFLTSILTEMVGKKVSSSEWPAFVSSRSAAGLSSVEGVHFLLVRHWKIDYSHGIAMSNVGFCIIFGAWLSNPLVSINFSALPSLFNIWYSGIYFGTLKLPNVLARYQRQWRICADEEVSVEERRLYDSYVCAVTATSKTEIISSGCPATDMSDVIHDSQTLPVKFSNVAGASKSVTRNNAVISSIKLRKRRRKSSLLMSSRVSRRSLLKTPRNTLLDAQNSLLNVDTRVKVHPIREADEFVPDREEPHDSNLGEDGAEQHAQPSPTSPSLKRRRTMIKSSMQRIKETKPAFAEAKQNVDMLSCSANVLVIESDRCWREEGAKILMELSSCNEWLLAVKFGGATKFLHKAQEMKPSSTNRFTHAIMWTSESGWKLEFCDKNDWNVFKEIAKECCERNVPENPVRIIPVPGVLEVSGYEKNFASSFMRPDTYIHMVGDEVDRVLVSENACYDMDSGDEKWLEQLNSSTLSSAADCSLQNSKDNFEKIISAFEKAAYSHPDDVFDQEKAANLCSQFGRRDRIASIFDYWMKKRKQKHSALVRVFQGQPSRKKQPTQKPLLRKRRSFKRQGSHVGRGKPDIFFEAAAEQDAMRKLRTAEAAATRAVDVAVRLRNRAQVLMANADLATYKCVMALRIAEAIQQSESPDLSSFILG